MAFHDLGGAGEVVARAYRLTFGQVSDLVAQESRHPVGHDLVQVDPQGGWQTPSQVYETLVPVGDLDGLPMLTLTTRRTLEESAPSAAYLRTILRGLHEVTGWSSERRAAYLTSARGVSPTWTPEALVQLCDEVTGA